MGPAEVGEDRKRANKREERREKRMFVQELKI